MEIDPFVQHFVDCTFKGMQRLVQNGEEVAPQVILFAKEGDGEAIIPLIGVGNYFQSKEGKRKLRDVVKNAWKAMASDKPVLKLIAVVMLSDAWVETVSIPEFDKIMKTGREAPFAPRPGMAEALYISVSLADEDVQYHWPYVRGSSGVVFASSPAVEKFREGPRALLMRMWPL